MSITRVSFRKEIRKDNMSGLYKVILDIWNEENIKSNIYSAPLWDSVSDAFDAGNRAVEYFNQNGNLPDLSHKW